MDATKRRQTLREHGARYMDDEDLLAALLERRSCENQSHRAKVLLEAAGGMRGMTKLTVEELMIHGGMTEVRAQMLYAAVQLGVRVYHSVEIDAPVIRDDSDIVNLIHPRMYGYKREVMFVITMGTGGKVQRVHEPYRGTIGAIKLRIAEVLRLVIIDDAPRMAVVHNHPSGNVQPSPEDILFTKQLQSSADEMDICLIDHVIVGGIGRSLSLRRAGHFGSFKTDCG